MKKNTSRRVLAILVVGFMCAIYLPLLSNNVEATPYGGIWRTSFPSSWPALSHYHGYRGTEPPISFSTGQSTGSCILNDTLYQEVYDYTGDDWWDVRVGGFTNPAYNGVHYNYSGPNTTVVGGPSQGGYVAVTNSPAANNATIGDVYIVVIFRTPSSVNPNYFDLQLSINGGTSWTSTGIGKCVFGTWHPASIYENVDLFFYEVTNWITWTPAILNSNSTMIRSILWPWAGADYAIDYLGLDYLWTAPNGWIPPLPGGGSAPSDDNEYPSISLGFNNGTFGLVGLIGVVITPPLAIWMVKRENMSKGKIVMGALIMMSLCGALFLGG